MRTIHEWSFAGAACRWLTSRTASAGIHIRMLMLALILLAGANPAFSFTGVKAVSVAGNHILYDGQDVFPKGFVIQAFEYHDIGLQECKDVEKFCARHLEAQDFFFKRGKFSAKGALDVAREWNANTIRFNVSQAALDPKSPNYSPTYVSTLEKAVQFARQQGFAVIVTLFDGRNRRAPDSILQRNPMTPLSDETTLQGALTLTAKFGHDTGVMIELLNENWAPVAKRQGWKLWRDGGTPRTGKYAGKTFLGVNEIVARMRQAGAQNVIIVQGLMMSFQGYPGGVKDPLNRMAFSVHPFLGKGKPQNINWDDNFGNFAKDHPFIVTAWNDVANQGWCPAFGLQKPAQLLEYLKQKRIGVMVYALDVLGRVFVDFRESLDNVAGYGKSCADGGSAGQLIRKFFSAN